jgi:hypothetical protein
MSTLSHNTAVAEDSRAGIADALVSYLIDCGLNESPPKSGNLVLALEYVYQPRLRFWRDISISHVIEAVVRCFPAWQESLGDMNRGFDSFMQDVQDFLQINAFDEGNAERLLTLPKHMRPSDPALAAAWLRRHFTRRSLKAELELARRDGNRAGEEALEVAHRLEQANRGVIIERAGTLVARAYRESIASFR